MKHVIAVFSLLALVSCNQHDDLVQYDNISDYHGHWHNTMQIDGETYIEDLDIDSCSNHIEYMLSNIKSYIIFNKQHGELVLGNENKIGWICISDIDKKARQTYWNVVDLSEDKMRLFSTLLGEHTFKKALKAASETFVIEDSIKSVLNYTRYLPMTKTSLTDSFGLVNRLTTKDEITYMTYHPLFNRIKFHENLDNDTIYTYSLFMTPEVWPNWKCVITTGMTKIRGINGTEEYCNAELLSKASRIVIIDSLLNCITISPVRDYEYWPNVSHHLGKSIEEAKREYESKYVYEHSLNAEDGLSSYKFQAKGDRTFKTIALFTDSMGIVKRCWINFVEKYSESQKDVILHLLRSRYQYMNNENNEIFFFSNHNSTRTNLLEIKYEARERKISYTSK